MRKGLPVLSTLPFRSCAACELVPCVHRMLTAVSHASAALHIEAFVLLCGAVQKLVKINAALNLCTVSTHIENWLSFMLHLNIAKQ